MIKFKPNNITEDNLTLGDELKQAREEKLKSLEQASKKTGVKVKFLQALEEGDYRELPSGIYPYKFLKKYTYFLNLNYTDLKTKLKKEKEIIGSEKSKKKGLFSQKKIGKKYFLVLPKIIKNFIIAGVITVFFLYLGFCVKNIILPPEVHITKPEKDLVTDNNFINVKGKTEEGAEIFINNSPVLKSENGSFHNKISLKKGNNTITITAQKKYSKKAIITRQILVK